MPKKEPGKWDSASVMVRELDMGVNDPFPEFADDVTEMMAEAGNEAGGRPCVMKVTVEVVEGKIDRSDLDADSKSDAEER